MEPTQTPEGALIAKALGESGESARTAASQIGISDTRLRQIISGKQPAGGGNSFPVIAPSITIARIAQYFDISPEELEEAGRDDAAEDLRKIWTGSKATAHDRDGETLPRLIKDRMGDLSYDRLARKSGLTAPTAGRNLHKLANKPFTKFPDAGTIVGLSRGLGVPPVRVLLACARSMGIPVPMHNPDDLVIPGAGRLPQDSQDAITEMADHLISVLRRPWGDEPSSITDELQSDHDLAASDFEDDDPETPEQTP